MTERHKKIIKLILRFLFTIILLVWVFSRVGLGQFWHTLATARWPYLLGSWICVVSFSIAQSKTLQIILRRQDCHVSVHTLFGASVATNLYSMFLPGMLSTGVKWYILKRETGKGTHVFSSMVYNQMALFATITTVGLITVLIMNPAWLLHVEPRQGRMLQVLAAVASAAMVLFCVFFLNPRTGVVLTRVLERSFQVLPVRIRLKGEELVRQVAIFQSAGPSFHLKVVAIDTLAVLLFGILTYICAAWAAGVSVPLGVFVFLYAGVYVLSKLPVTVANLGLREVTVVGVLTGHGVPASSALLMSMILFSCHLFLAVIGAIYQLSWMSKFKQSETPMSRQNDAENHAGLELQRRIRDDPGIRS